MAEDMTRRAPAMMDSVPATPITMAEIEAAAYQHRVRLDAASALVADVASEMAAVRVRYHDAITEHAALLAESHAAVVRLVDGGRHLFRKPKSVVVHGLKIGLRQVGGAWDWPTPADLVRLVRERLAPSRAAALIQVTEAVQISTLTPADRVRLGVERGQARDVPLVGEVERDTARALLALLAASEQDTGEAQP
jgi:hypothetical protein